MDNKKLAVLFLGLAIVFTGTWTYIKAGGNEITACVKKDGSLYVPALGSNCKGQDTLLSWNIVGPQGPKGDKGDAGKDATTHYLQDGNSQSLGMLLGIKSDDNYSKLLYSVYIRSLDVVVEFSEEFGTIKRRGVSGSVYFTDRDCQGLAYGDMTSRRQLSETMSNGTIFRGESTGPIDGTSLVFQSFINRTQSCQNMQPQGISRTIFEAEIISLPFSEPVILPLTIIEL
ncbi:MAG: hypothetical protein AAB392_02015 [Patescibacteria group bacterium]